MSEIWYGMGCLRRGIAAYYTSPGLWKYGLIPILILLAAYLLVMAGLSDAQSDRLLAALRLCLQPNIALKAVLTPANRRWTAAYLYQELCMEHAALRAGKGARG